MLKCHHGSDWQCFCVCLLSLENEWEGQAGSVFYVSNSTYSLGLYPVQPGPNSGQNTALRFLHAIPREATTDLCPWKTWAYNMHHWILYSSTQSGRTQADHISARNSVKIAIPFTWDACLEWHSLVRKAMGHTVRRFCSSAPKLVEKLFLFSLQNLCKKELEVSCLL